MKTNIAIFVCWAAVESNAFTMPRIVNYPSIVQDHVLSQHLKSLNKYHIVMQLSPIDEDEKENVNVNLVDDVDSFTLTAIGFALIAFNFLVFANMGDAGIGGIVARIINATT